MSDSDSDEEKTISYGTPLDPIEEDEIPSKRKFQQAPDQYAVDSHGRRRFHGAFTGGFSAGYGNTVGTPEGFIPAAFKSSRSEKASVSAQRAEDFMDEEDRDEFGIAPRHLQTRGDFAGQKRPRQRYHDGPIPGEPVLSQLLSAVHETAAVKMLRSMGWRPGQGTGERVNRAEKKKQKEQHKVYGCYVPPEMRQNTEEDSQSSSDSEFEYDTLFAPDDYEPYVLQRKSDRFGLGYSGLSRHSVLGSLAGPREGATSHLVMTDKGKKVSIRGQAFGVGAFEADDEDIYATEDMSHYDFAIGGAESKQKKPTTKERGVNVLEGFVKAKNPIPPVTAAPLPALPRDYRPAPASARKTRFEPTTAPERDQGLGRHELTAEARGALLGEAPIPKPPDPPTPNPTLPNPAQTPEDPIAKLLGRNVNFVSNESTSSKELDFIPIKDTGNEVPKTFKPFASTPDKQARYDRYLKDKEAFLREGDGSMDAVTEWERNRELAEFEQAAKLYKPLTGFMGDRFTHASEPDDSTNPLTAVSRSNTSYGLVTPEQMEAAKKGVYGVMTRKETQWNPESLVCKRFNIPVPGGGRSNTSYGLVTPEQMEAAKKGVYGVMTRKETQWNPESLVCKRFNIPVPGGGRSESKKEDKPKVAYSIFSYMESVHDKDSFAAEQHKFSGSRSLNLPKPTQNTTQPRETNTNDIQNKVDNSTPSTSETFNKRMTVAELFMKESEKDLKSNEVVTETIEKFDKMDLYKAIFLSDSENEEETPKPKDTTKENDVNPNDFIETPANVVRNTSPPRGIFANVDFDELNSWRRNINVKTTDKNEKDDNKNAEKDKQNVEEKDKQKVNSEADVYGPKIPETLQKRLEAESINDTDFKPVFRRKTDITKDVVEVESSSSDSWVDVKEVKGKKQKKKKKKHKTKHKKSKHKKKDR